MEISGIFGMQYGMELPMTEEQKSGMEEILAKYDPENFTAEDMKSMRKELQEAGVPPSREGMQMMREAGFQMRPPQNGMSLLDVEDGQETSRTGTSKGELWELYQQLKTGEIGEEEFLSLIRGQTASGSLIDYIS